MKVILQSLGRCQHQKLMFSALSYPTESIWSMTSQNDGGNWLIIGLSLPAVFLTFLMILYYSPEGTTFSTFCQSLFSSFVFFFNTSNDFLIGARSFKTYALGDKIFPVQSFNGAWLWTVVLLGLFICLAFAVIALMWHNHGGMGNTRSDN